MSRANERIKKKMEKNPIRECNRIQQKFYPGLFLKFNEVKDPRHQSYIKYSNEIMLGTIYYKGIGGIVSMQEMTTAFNHESVSRNLSTIICGKPLEYLPHHVTENEYLEKLSPEEIEEINNDIVYQMIRRKTFNNARFRKKWLVIVDGTELYTGKRQLNDKCLERHFNKGTENEIINYYRSVLEAKIYLGDNLVASIGSEFIENNSEDAERQKMMGEEQIKQDCETKAFVRLAEKIKRNFPRLPVCILADSLYASEKVMDICREYKWDFIIRYKSGSIPTIAQEYEAIPEKETAGNTEFVNAIDYRDAKVNVLRYREDKVKQGKIITTEFQWITNIEINKGTAESMAETGRKRWKIENQGFNRQKNWQGDITHACSWNDNAQKCHYLMHQIADFFLQLYEYYYLEQNRIKKTQKNISSDMLASFTMQLTAEDINAIDMPSISTN